MLRLLKEGDEIRTSGRGGEDKVLGKKSESGGGRSLHKEGRERGRERILSVTSLVFLVSSPMDITLWAT